MAIFASRRRAPYQPGPPFVEKKLVLNASCRCIITSRPAFVGALPRSYPTEDASRNGTSRDQMSSHLRSLVISISSSLLSGLLAAALWFGGLLEPAQRLFIIEHRDGVVAPPRWVGLMCILAASFGAGFAVERLGGRRALGLICGALLILCGLSFGASALLGIDTVFAPCALGLWLGATAVQVRRLGEIDAALTRAVETRAFEVDRLASKAGERVDAALRLLDSIFDLEEAIIFQLDRGGLLQPAARHRAAENGSAAELGRLREWREGVALCERALRARALQVNPSGRKVAVPLIHEAQEVGALLVHLNEPFAQTDRGLLDSIAAQIARSFQRQRALEKAVGRKFPALISTRAARKRLELFGVVSGQLIERGFAANALTQTSDAYAIAYLDGTLAIVNRAMEILVEAEAEEMRALDLFSLLDRFRTGVFDEPAIAVRRVLQTGEPYERELYYAERDRTLALRISLIVEPSAGPVGFLLAVRDITRLKEYEQLRSDMVSLMSHELRTPITSINGFAELLAMDENLPADAREFATIIHQESQRLSRMIDTFLRLTRLEAADRQEMRQVPLRLDEVVRETVSNFQAAAKKKRIRLIEKTNGKIPPVAADRGLIMRAVANLVDNAIRYSPEKTTVTVSTELEADAVRVIVEDQGYGIPPEARDRVWEKFYRVARDGQEKDEESTGLGLAFVREVVERHKGQVSLESEVGRGSKFSFTLPRL